jgi:hypothetical protein
MQYPGYNTGKITLCEGEWFPFKVYNLIRLQDEAWYYVLQDINGLKHFMPAQYYAEYGFKVGDEITCKVDRINCTGRLFLEPKHPFYTEGNHYLFDLLSDPNPVEEKAIIVKEIFGNSIQVPLYGINKIHLNGKLKVSCVVKNIKKGKPILELLPDCS